MINHYDNLGVSKDASDEEIKMAYKKKAQKHHPDKEGGNEKEFKIIQESYMILSCHTSRKRYDNGEDVGRREPSIKEKSMHKFAEYIEKNISQANDYVNMINEISKNIQADKRNLVENIKQAENAIKKLRHIKDRIKYNGSGPNLFEESIKHKIRGAENHIRNCTNGIEILSVVENMVKDYECEVKEQEAVTVHIPFGYTTYTGA